MSVDATMLAVFQSCYNRPMSTAVTTIDALLLNRLRGFFITLPSSTTPLNRVGGRIVTPMEILLSQPTYTMQHWT